MKRICGILTFFTFSGLLLPPITYFFFLIMYVSNAIRDKKKEKLNLFFFWWLQPLTSLFWKSVSLTDKKKQARTVMIYSESFIFFNLYASEIYFTYSFNNTANIQLKWQLAFSVWKEYSRCLLCCLDYSISHSFCVWF